MSVSQAVGAQIPALRRFARALTGSQTSGDAYVTETLETLLADPTLIPTESDVKAALYKLFLAMWTSVEVNRQDSAQPDLAAPDRNLQEISAGPRQAFLLTALEEFSVKDAARVMLVSEEKFERLLEEAGREIAEQAACDVLIIEDEPLIAIEVAEIASSMGHTVRHVARTHREAIEAVGKHRPNLVLADIKLADGSSGMEAVEEILESIDVPVVFITAFPERLLTGKKPEPTYLIQKPFRPETVKALISQALFFHAPRQKGKASGNP
jgi:CheY-like chemotaxis protein/DNA-directed RNA polymerase specialized sigma24 family protein